MKNLAITLVALSFFACGQEEEPETIILTDTQTQKVETEENEPEKSGCMELSDCVQKCGGNVYCENECFEKQPLAEGTKLVGLLVCTDTEAERCVSESCVERECDSYIKTCEGPEHHQLSCGESFDCMAGCLSWDDTCKANCVGLVSDEGREAFDDMRLCFSDCGGEEECIEHYCEEEIDTCFAN